jgi:DNA-binding Lrp family transcriptional regulator
MVQAYVFINAASSKANSIFKALKNNPKVKQVHIVTGLHDLIAFIEAEDVTKLVKAITDDIQSIDGITKTVTCLAVATE